MTELTINHPTFGSVTPSEVVEMTREVMHGEVPPEVYHAKLTHALALMVQRLDERKLDKIIRDRDNPAVCNFAERMADKFIRMAAETECDRPTFSMSLRDAARLLREEVGL